MSKLIHVAAAVILNDKGQVLLAKRPDDKHQGGLWEFPGGKVEPDEPVLEALTRELDEELGIRVTSARPLIQVPHHYPDKSVLLDVFEVDAFSGEPWGREGQPVRWVDSHLLDDYDFPAANRPILAAAQLPSRLVITGAAESGDEYVAKLAAAVEAGAEGVMLRAKQLSEEQFESVAGQCIDYCKGKGIFLSLNCAIEQANALNAEALHLSSDRLMQLQSREQFNGRWLSASCHCPEQLEKAQSLGLDFVTLSPVQVTRSHPETEPMGWERFSALAAETQIPVYGLGGLGEANVEQAWAAGAQGVAAISAWWG